MTRKACIALQLREVGGDDDDLGADDFVELPAEAVVPPYLASKRGRRGGGRAVAGQTGGIGDPDRSAIEARPAGRFTLTDDFAVLAAAEVIDDAAFPVGAAIAGLVG